MSKVILMYNMIKYGSWSFFTPDSLIECELGGTTYELGINVFIYIVLAVSIVHLLVYLATDSQELWFNNDDGGDDYE